MIGGINVGCNLLRHHGCAMKWCIKMHPTRDCEFKMIISNHASICLLCLTLALGCAGKPNAANIELRKELQKVRVENEDLKRGHDADLASIASLKERQPVTATLPEDRIAKLFTAHGIAISKLTSSDTRNLKVVFTPTDDDAQKFKAAGSIVVEAFDLAKSDQNKIGEWKWDVDQARSKWNGEMIMYAYVLECPWAQTPTATNLTVKVTFIDELTGRAISSQKQIVVKQ